MTEDGDNCEVATLRRIARECGLAEEVVERCVMDRRGDEGDEGVMQWSRNHEEAMGLGGCSGGWEGGAD